MSGDERRDQLARHVIRAADQARAAGLDVADLAAALSWALGEVLAETTALSMPGEACRAVMEAGFAAKRQGRGL